MTENYKRKERITDMKLLVSLKAPHPPPPAKKEKKNKDKTKRMRNKKVNKLTVCCFFKS